MVSLVLNRRPTAVSGGFFPIILSYLHGYSKVVCETVFGGAWTVKKSMQNRKKGMGFSPLEMQRYPVVCPAAVLHLRVFISAAAHAASGSNS